MSDYWYIIQYTYIRRAQMLRAVLHRMPSPEEKRKKRPEHPAKLIRRRPRFMLLGTAQSTRIVPRSVIHSITTTPHSPPAIQPRQISVNFPGSLQRIYNTLRIQISSIAPRHSTGIAQMSLWQWRSCSSARIAEGGAEASRRRDSMLASA